MRKPARVLTPAVLVLGIGLAACRPPAPVGPVGAAAPGRMSWRVASAHLEDLFAEIPGSSIEDFRREPPEEERKRVNAAHGEAGLRADRAHIYGEPSPQATDSLLRRAGVGEKDVVYDLGCGRGFFLMQALLSTPARKAVGVELAPTRIAVGRRAQGLLAARGLMPPGKVLELREGDLARTSLEDATVVFMDSVFFSDELLATVARRMAQAGRVRAVVMIMKGLPPNPWFELEATERLKMSWSPRFGSDVLFYRRTPAAAD